MSESASRSRELDRLAATASLCERCCLCEGRTQVVFGSGNADAKVMFVGEAPGESEDRLGVPFVGRSGELLTSLLAEVGITRDEVFISNVVKCRPPGNRDPKPQEVESCSPWLHRQIEIIGPDLICTLGNFATKLLRGDDTGISKVHGQLEEVTVAAATLKLYPLFHPAAALRSKTTLAHLRSDLAAITRIIQGSQDVPRQADHAKDDC